jgi:hypothetical protein
VARPLAHERSLVQQALDERVDAVRGALVECPRRVLADLRIGSREAIDHARYRRCHPGLHLECLLVALEGFTPDVDVGVPGAPGQFGQDRRQFGVVGRRSVVVHAGHGEQCAPVPALRHPPVVRRPGLP